MQHFAFAVVLYKKITMKRFSYFTVFAFAITMLTSCQLIGDIFKAGVWSGVILVVVVIAVIIWIIAKVAGGGKR
ncbi:hypothetical protein DI53_1320 [Sphingobacterium deserti]|uniref:Phosphatidate cytidylyltransferase n=2 Tax=Sphingobacterium deserti TaxID=1229276 RepID=A0A0B8T9V7_9SPHI|nr:hypothetical protein DI53_1320 [Sphingobacterium deserti]